jgi:hypothetical protein
MSDKIQDLKTLTERVNAFRKSATTQNGNPKGDNVTDVDDPSNKGVVSVPSHPDGDDPKKTQLPPNGTNEDGQKDNLTNRPGQVGSGGACQVPGGSSPIDGNAKDEAATSPTVALDKIAAKVAKTVKALKAITKSSSNKESGSEGASAPSASSAPEKKAGDTPLLDPSSPEFFDKLAHSVRAIVEVEGGAELVEQLMRKHAGVEAARALVGDIVTGYNEAVKQAASEIQKEQAAELQKQQMVEAFSELTKNASEEDKNQIIKLAEVVVEGAARIEDPILKQAFANGAADAAAMEDAGALPGAEGDLSIEQIVQLIESMVQSGELDPQTAEALLQALLAEETGGAVPGGEGAVPSEEEAAALAAAEAGGVPPGGMEAAASTSGGKTDAVHTAPVEAIAKYASDLISYVDSKTKKPTA